MAPRILVLGDTQTCPKNMELTKQFLDWVNKVRLAGYSAIVHLGDVKEHLNPVDSRVTELWASTFAKWRKDHDVFVLAGNHDATSIQDQEYHWLQVVSEASGVTLVKTPRSYRVSPTLRLCFLPFHRDARTVWVDASKKFLQTKDPSCSDYLFLHGDVSGVDYGHKLAEGPTPDELRLDKYTACFGGHIHRYQTLGNLTIVGSPWAMNWGEANHPKYVLELHAGVKPTIKLLAPPIPGIYDPSKGKPYQQDMRAVRVQVNYSDAADMQRQSAEAKAKYKALYPDAEVEVIPVPLNNSVAADETTTSATVAEAIKSYAAAVNVKGLEAYLRYVLTEVDSIEDAITFKHLEGANVLSFEDVKIDFDALDGLKLVLGENQDWPGRSNGAGKSNYLQLLLLAIFGKTLKKQEADGWRRQGSKGPAWVRLTFTKGSQDYVLERTRNPTALRLWSGGVEVSTGDTQRAVEELMGISWTLATNTLYIDQNSIHKLVAGTDGDKKSLLYDFLRLEMFEKAAEVAKRHRSTAEKALVNYQLLLSSQDAKVGGLRDSLTRMPKPDTGIATQLEKEEETYRKRKASLSAYDSTQPVFPEAEYKQSANALAVARQRYSSLATGAKDCPTCGKPMGTVDPALVASAKKEKDIAATVFEGLNKKKEAYEEFKEEQRSKLNVLKSLEVMILSLKQRLADQEKLATAIAEQKQALADAEEQHVKMRTWEAPILDDIAFTKIAVKALSKDGIPALICANVCPILTDSAQMYSDLLADGEIAVNFQVNNKDDFKIDITNRHGGQNLKDQSAGELRMASLITALAFRDLYPRTNILVVDEPAEGLDEANARMLARAMLRLGVRYDALLVSTHNVHAQEELAAAGVVRIVKKNGVSRVA